MMDEPYIAEPENKVFIDINKDWELVYWSSYLEISEYELVKIVATVGPYLKTVKGYIEAQQLKLTSR